MSRKKPEAAQPAAEVKKTRSARNVPFEGGVPVAKAVKKTVTKAEPPPVPVKAGKLKIPKSLGACVDLLKSIEQTRLAKAKELEVFSEQEKVLRAHLIDQLPKSQLGGVAGKNYRAEIKRDHVPQVEDWSELQKHIKKTGDFDLLGRSINKKAVEERWGNKKKVPGVKSFEIIKLSVTKL